MAGRLAVKARNLGVLASIVEAAGKAVTALGKIGKSLHDEIEAFTLGMNSGNIRITRKLDTLLT